MYIYIYIYIHIHTYINSSANNEEMKVPRKPKFPKTNIPKDQRYGVATISRLLKIIGLFDKRAL